jgi:DNA polymerase-3 subunit epsilon
MIYNVLIVDCETTGLSPKDSQIIEIAAILYSVKHNNILQTCSTLIPCKHNPVQYINNISADLTNEGYFYQSALSRIKEMITDCDAIVAHNAPFDKGFLGTFIPEFLEKEWICTKNDFKWPVILQRKRLQDVCDAMGVPYINAHRALQDCLLIANCFSKIENLSSHFHSKMEK